MKPADATETIRAGQPRLVVLPFRNGSGQKLQDYLSLGLSMILAEKLETETKNFRVLNNGPMIMSAEQARLFADTDIMASASEFARKKKATHFLTGRFSGKTWEWSLTVEVWTIGNGQVPHLEAKATVNGPQTGPYRLKNGHTVHIVYMSNIQAMLTEATTQAMGNAGLPLSEGTLAELKTLPTKDAWAFQVLARAYDAHFATGRKGPKKSDIAEAENAVKVDPTYVQAQRLYALLLERDGLPVKAIIHLEAALAQKPQDLRALTAIGRLELAQGHPEAARDYLIRAIAVAPREPAFHFQLAEIRQSLGDSASAMTEYETVRRLDPKWAEARKRLGRLYAEAKRYRQAGDELKAAIRLTPEDLTATFQAAACYRAAGRKSWPEAIGIYRNAAFRFIRESRLPKFEGDILKKMGRKAEAAESYRRALTLAPNDRRLRDILGVRPENGDEDDSRSDGNRSPAIGGFELTRSIADGTDLAEKMDTARNGFRLAANDASLETDWHGKEACLPPSAAAGSPKAEAGAAEGDTPAGNAAASLSTAESFLTAHGGLREKFTSVERTIASARNHGEESFLTPDETATSARLTVTAETAAVDSAEIDALYGSLKAKLARFGCPTSTPGTPLADIERRNIDRRVKLPPVKPPTWSLPISPNISPELARSVIFDIDNTRGSRDYLLTVNGIALGLIPAGQMMFFSLPIGHHTFCLLPNGIACGPAGTVRRAFIHDGWQLVIRPNQP